MIDEKTIKDVLSIIVVGVGGLIWWLIKVYNLVLPLTEKCNELKKNIAGEEERALSIFEKFFNAISQGTDHEKKLVSSIFNRSRDILNKGVSHEERLAEMSQLMLIVPPQISSIQLYAQTQTEIAATLTRIQVARENFNAAEGVRNTEIKKFPNLIACAILKIKST